GGGQVGDAARGLALAEPELAEGGGGQVGDHRVGLAPGERGAAAGGGFAAQQLAVGQRGHPARDGDLEVEGGLVGRVVVGGEPGAGAVRLRGDERAVLGGDE